MVYGENTINRIDGMTGKLADAQGCGQARGARWTPVRKYTLINLVQIITYYLHHRLYIPGYV